MSTFPYLSVVGDFNNDNFPDVALIVQDPDSCFWLSILLNDQTGDFGSPVFTAISFDTRDLVTVGDLNSDGFSDVVLVRSNSVEVFTGDGTGHFTRNGPYTTGIYDPVAVTVANAIGNGSVDVVIAGGTPDATGKSPVVALVGNGTGALGAVATTHYNGTMTYGVLADLNGDAYLDLVSGKQIYWGTGGDFQTGAALSSTDTCSFPLGIEYGSVAVADVTNDGLPDILAADCSHHTITAYINSGSGTFSEGTSTWAAESPATITVANVDADTTPDVIVGDFYSMDVKVLIGHGDGTFDPPGVGYALGGDLWTPPVAAQFDTSGHIDIVVPSGIGDQWASLVRMTGLGDGTFAAPRDYFYAGLAAGSTAYSSGIATADLNADGVSDVVVGNLSYDANIGITVYLSNSESRNLQPGVNYGSGGYLQYVALADIDGDGNLDLIASNTTAGGEVISGDIQIFRGIGYGVFQSTPTSIPVVLGSGLGRLVVGDFDEDGKKDIAVLDTGVLQSDQSFPGHVWLLINNSTPGSPSFASPVSLSLPCPGGEIVAADLGNNHLDLAVTTGTISVLLGSGNGQFTVQPEVDLGFSIVGLAIAKLNSSAHPDLVVTVDDDPSMGVAVVPGNGNGTFDTPVFYPAKSDTSGILVPYPAAVRVADLDGDGKLDLVFTNSGDGAIGVLYGTGQWGSGEQSFYAPVEFAVGGLPTDFVLADVNGDGTLDAVIDGMANAGLTTFLNTGANRISLTTNSNPSSVGTTVTVTATVAASPLPGTSGTSPTGSVTFKDSVLGNLGVVNLSGGVATISTSELNAGTHLITAVYSGDTNLVGQTTGTLVQNVNAATPSYTLSANPTSATLHPGESATFSISATPVGGYTGTVSFSCGTLPAGVSCTFTPATLILDGTHLATTNLKVTVASSLVAYSSAATSPVVAFTGMAFGLLGCISLGAVRRRNRKSITSVALLVAITLILAATGCGGSTNKPAPKPQVTSVKIVATATSNGSSQQLNLTLNIQQ